MSADGIGSSGTTVNQRDVAGALPLLRIAARWALTPARWAAVGRMATSAMAAVATDDGPAVRASLAGITVLGPARTATATAAGPAPDDVLADLTALIDVLEELESLADP